MANIAYDDLAAVDHKRRPAHISRWGWKDIAVRTFKEVMDDRVMLFAGGVTYFLLLALFPAVTAFISIYGLFTDPLTVSEQVSALSAFVPPGGLAIISDQLHRVTEQGTPTLSIALLVSLVIALWSTSSGIKALFEAMNIAYDEKETRGFIKLNVIALLFTLASIVGAIVTLGVVIAIPIALGFFGFSEGFEWLIQIAGYAVLVAVLFAGILALYRFGPARRIPWRETIPGAILALIVIGVASALFSWYAASFGHFDKTYGSLGALIGFLFWVWLSVMAVIVGAELNSEIDHQRTLQQPAPRVAESGDAHTALQPRQYAKAARRALGSSPGMALAIAIPVTLLLTVLGRGRR